jgi:hypothetical protein
MVVAHERGQQETCEVRSRGGDTRKVAEKQEMRQAGVLHLAVMSPLWLPRKKYDRLMVCDTMGSGRVACVPQDLILGGRRGGTT